MINRAWKQDLTLNTEMQPSLKINVFALQIGAATDCASMLFCRTLGEHDIAGHVVVVRL